jgi:hypothetical protein
LTEPFLVTEALTDTIEVDASWSLDATLVVSPPTDAIELETDVLIGQGQRGPQGLSPFVSKYGSANAAIASGVLTLNAAAASTFWVTMDQDVSSLVVTDWADDRAQRIHVYIQQDATGGRAFATDAWPSGTRWSYGVRPSGTAAGTIESFVLEHLPVGNLVFAAVVGQFYQ